MSTCTKITPEQKQRLKRSQAVRKGKRTAAIALDEAIARAVEKERN